MGLKPRRVWVPLDKTGKYLYGKLFRQETKKNRVTAIGLEIIVFTTKNQLGLRLHLRQLQLKNSGFTTI